MQDFVDGAIYEENHETPLGQVTVLAEVAVLGGHLVLDELMMYPTDQEERLPIGVKRILEILARLRELAKEQGYTEMTAVFHRTGIHRNTGKRRKGDIISFTRRLR